MQGAFYMCYIFLFRKNAFRYYLHQPALFITFAFLNKKH